MLGLWDGNPVKLDCDDHYTTTEMINALSNKKIKIKIKIFKRLMCLGNICIKYDPAPVLSMSLLSWNAVFQMLIPPIWC